MGIGETHKVFSCCCCIEIKQLTIIAEEIFKKCNYFCD